MVNKTGNRIRILQRCKFRFRYRFHPVYNDYIRSSLPFSIKLCVQLGNVVAYMPVVYKTIRKSTYNFRGVRISILTVSQLRLPCFSTNRHKTRTDLKLICIDFISSIKSINETGNRIRILERWKFRFRFHSFLNTHAILYLISQHFACRCKMSSASQVLFLWRTGSRYPILEVCEVQFWQCRDSSCYVFSTNFGRFGVAFDRLEFDRTQ